MNALKTKHIDKRLVVLAYLFFHITYLAQQSWAEQGLSNHGTASTIKTSFLSRLEAIYMDYHNWKIDEGLAKAQNALNDIDKLYNNNPNEELNEPKLKLNKIYQIKSVLHTLSGMLYYRKSFLVSKESTNPIVEKLKQNKKLTDEDLANLAQDKSFEKKSAYFKKAINEFEKAIQIDPQNPTPHYQLGTIYAPLASSGYSQAAEKEFFLAAQLSHRERDMPSALKAVESLKILNPQSNYLKEIDAILKVQPHER
jgi:tetratricopeptide (TPR) repeat protein